MYQVLPAPAFSPTELCLRTLVETKQNLNKTKSCWYRNLGEKPRLSGALVSPFILPARTFWLRSSDRTPRCCRQNPHCTSLSPSVRSQGTARDPRWGAGISQRQTSELSSGQEPGCASASISSPLFSGGFCTSGQAPSCLLGNHGALPSLEREISIFILHLHDLRLGSAGSLAPPPSGGFPRPGSHAP